MFIFMARNLEKGALATAEDKAARIAKFACEKETCAIQACLQGINTHTSICALEEFCSLVFLNHAHQNILTNLYVVFAISLAHRYQEGSCIAQIEALQKCCERLSPLTLKHSESCQGILLDRK